MINLNLQQKFIRGHWRPFAVQLVSSVFFFAAFFFGLVSGNSGAATAGARWLRRPNQIEAFGDIFLDQFLGQCFRPGFGMGKKRRNFQRRLATRREVGPEDHVGKCFGGRGTFAHHQFADGHEFKAIRRGWCLGSEIFRKELLESVHTRATESHHAITRRETTEEKARRILNEELDKLGWTGAELAGLAKGDARKLRVAQRLRAETAVTLKWIATELHMGTWTHVANRLQNAKGKSEPTNQPQFGLV